MTTGIDDGVGQASDGSRHAARPGGSTDGAARSIFAALVRRAIATWVLLRLFILAVTILLILQGGDGTLFFSIAPVLLLPIAAGLLSEVDVARRHERTLLGNLGVSIPVRISIATGVAAAGETLFALGSSLLRG